MGGSWATRPVQRRQASSGAEIETKRVQSRGRWDDLTVRSRGVQSHGAISAGRSPQRDLNGASSTVRLGLGRWSELDGASPISLSLVFLCALSLSLSLSLRV